MLLQLDRLPKNLVAPHLRLYGGTKIATLEKMTGFALEESSTHCPFEVESAAHALLHVSCFLELLVTLRAKNRYLKTDFVEWEALVCAFAEAANLEDIEAEYLEKDAAYKKKDLLTPPMTLNRKLKLPIAMAHDNKTANSLVVPLLGVTAAPGKGNLKLGAGTDVDEKLLELRERAMTDEGSSKPGKVGAAVAASAEDEELLELQERVRVVEEKILLRQRLAKLEAELGS